MKIIREGKEIELTQSEMIDAYFEQERQWDRDRITELIEGHDELQELNNDMKLFCNVAVVYRETADGSYDEDDELNWLMDAYEFCKNHMNH